jgi:hypothetical protein
MKVLCPEWRGIQVIQLSFFTKLKPYVELKKASKRSKKNTIKKVAYALRSESGGGVGIIFIGLAAILLAFVVFINIVDYSLYTYKRNAISRAMDYGITAAVQQIDKNQSTVGVANGFTEDTGEKRLEDIEINVDTANNTFLNVFYANYKLDGLSIHDNLLICATSSHNERLRYSIKAKTELIFEGDLDNCMMVEDRINQAIEQFWPSSNENKVYVNGNPKTNIIENGTYLFAYINDIKITGLYSQRQINLSSFAGAKLERFIKN